MKVMIVNAFGRSNRGDSVLLDECIFEVKSSIPNCEISGAVFEGIDTIEAIHKDIEWSERIGNTNLQGAIGKFLTLFYLFIAIISSFKFFRLLKFLLPKKQRITLDNIKKSDYIISAPGGYIHDTNFAYFIALLHLWLGIGKGKKVILAPQSIGPIDKKISRVLAKKIFLKMDVICARESYTYDFLINELSLNGDLVFPTGDSAFWNFFVNDDEKLINTIYKDIGVNDYNNKKIFGITVVDWSFPKSKNPIKDQENYARSMATIIDYMVNKYDCTPVIFNQVSEDLPMAKKIATYASSAICIDLESREPEILRALISKATIFLGTRFHSCIFSMMAGRPTFAISYLPKTSYILNDLKLSHRQTSIEDLSIDKIISVLEHDLMNNFESAVEIKSAVNAYRENFLQLRDFL